MHQLSAIIIIILSLVSLSACENKAKEGTDSERAVPVRLVTAKAADVPSLIEAVGNVEAFSSVQVKSQVGGQIIEVPVVSGQEVKAGDLLFRLDPRPFDAAVAESGAKLSRDKALLAKARQDLTRYSSLLGQKVISREAYDQVATEEKTIKANIEQAEAALRTAQLNREYSEIKSPVDGKLGSIMVPFGNVIKANDERTLVVINSIRPAEVRFTVAERYLPALLKRMKEGQLDVLVLPEGDSGEPIQGRVTAINNEVDRSTGSIRLHALFDNFDDRLWPGQFVRVRIEMATIRDAVIVPERAVLEGFAGQYVYLAFPEGEKHYRVRPQAVSTARGPDNFFVVTNGLQAGELIISDGQLGLSPGALAVDMGAGESLGQKNGTSTAAGRSQKSTEGNPPKAVGTPEAEQGKAP